MYVYVELLEANGARCQHDRGGVKMTKETKRERDNVKQQGNQCTLFGFYPPCENELGEKSQAKRASP